MNTQVRDMYINVLEKRAAEAAVLGIDNQEVANKEVDSNNSDQRAQLSGLFSTSAGAQKDTKQLGKLLPIAKKTPGTSSSNPMLKVAMHEAFFEGVRRTEMFKTASNEYLRAAFRGFEDEMSKVARSVPSTVKFAGAQYKDAVAKFAASFTPVSAIRARQEHENQPENFDPSQTAFRSTAR